MDLAILFNDAGCRLYEMGRYDAANDLFSGAQQAIQYAKVTHMRKVLNDSTFEMLLIDPSVQRAFDRLHRCGKINASSARNNHRYNDESDQSHYHSHQKMENEIQKTPSAQSLDAPFMCTNPFELSQLLLLPCEFKYIFELGFAIICFNRGLLLHLGQVPNTQRSLERAMSLYSLAVRSILDVLPKGFMEYYTYTSSFGCAILNNTGYLLHQTGDYESSKICFYRLCEFLLCLQPPKNNVEMHEREEYGLNFLLFAKTFNPAAAA